MKKEQFCKSSQKTSEIMKSRPKTLVFRMSLFLNFEKIIAIKLQQGGDFTLRKQTVKSLFLGLRF